MADDLPAIARFTLEQPRRARDLDRFADVAHFHRQVDTLAGVDRHRDLVGDGGGESLKLGAEAVDADAHVEKLVAALAVADRDRGDAGIGILEGNGRARDDTAGGIGDRSEHGCRVELR